MEPREILEIREAISRSSTAKYKAFEMRSRTDGRARDNTIFYGAHTGRKSGTGLQPQNLFKTVIEQEDLEAGLSLIQNQDKTSIEALFEKPMDLYASAIRSCIVAGKGKVLEVGDFATIEVRVLFWLAGDKLGLKALAEGRDLYLEMGAYIYRMKLEKLIKLYEAGSSLAKKRRQLGKQTILGAGFGMGVNGIKFQKTCKQYGIEISLELAKTAIRAYREMRPKIPAFWQAVERAAFLAIQTPGRAIKCGKVIWEMQGEFLTVTLPMGRKIYYFQPQINGKQTLYGPKWEISYMGIESKTKKFCRLPTWGGKLTENIVQGVAADLLMEAELRLEKTQIHLPILSVHDEIVCERDKEKGTLKEFEEIMSETPDWAEGLPIKAEAWCEKRYRK